MTFQFESNITHPIINSMKFIKYYCVSVFLDTGLSTDITAKSLPAQDRRHITQIDNISGGNNAVKKKKKAEQGSGKHVWDGRVESFFITAIWKGLSDSVTLELSLEESE